MAIIAAGLLLGVATSATPSYLPGSPPQFIAGQSCSSGQCISLTASSSTFIGVDKNVTFRAVDSDSHESNDSFTTFMDCGCSGGVAHGHFVDGSANFSVRFTIGGIHKVWTDDGDESNNKSVSVYSNSVTVYVGVNSTTTTTSSMTSMTDSTTSMTSSSQVSNSTSISSTSTTTQIASSSETESTSQTASQTISTSSQVSGVQGTSPTGFAIPVPLLIGATLVVVSIAAALGSTALFLKRRS
jgi:hypothetical protein